MGGNKVAPLKKAGQPGNAPQTSGKTYTKPAGSSAIGGGAARKFGGASAGGASAAEIEQYE